MSYSAIEQALLARLVEHFPDELAVSNCRAGDFDGIVSAIFTGNLPYGCVVEFGGGRDRADKPFNRVEWVWSLECIFLVRYQGDPVQVETDMRRIVDKLWVLFDDGKFDLGGVTPRARITSIARPEIGEINEVPFYFVSFGVEALDR